MRHIAESIAEISKFELDFGTFSGEKFEQAIGSFSLPQSMEEAIGLYIN